MSDLRRAVTGAAIALSLAGCSAPPPVAAPASAASFIPAKTATPTPASKVTKTPQEIALTLAELPAGFKLTADRATTIDSLSNGRTDPAAARAQLVEKGYVGGWFREYRKDGLFGVVLATSGVGTYASADGAKFGLSLNVQTTTGASNPGVQISLGDTIGDESIGYQVDAPGTDGNTIFTNYVIYFRVGYTSNSVVGAGPKGTIDISTVLDLVRKQLARAKQ